MIIFKSERELVYMRDAGRLVARTIAEVAKAVAPGVTTLELDRIAAEFIIKHGGTPSFKGYQGFPGNICTSINEEVVHGIPSLRKLKSGDNVSIDIGAIVNGYNGDAAVTLPVGEVDPEVQRLLDKTEECLYKGIEQAVSGNHIGDISHAIQTHAEANGYSVVRSLVGHGIGRNMHEDPQVPNFGKAGTGPQIRSGLVLAIEPMLNEGESDVRVLEDGWTVVTVDGGRSVHFEHSVAVTDDGPVVLSVL